MEVCGRLLKVVWIRFRLLRTRTVFNSVNVIKRIAKNLLTTYIGRGKEMIFLAIDFLSNKEMSKIP